MIPCDYKASSFQFFDIFQGCLKTWRLHDIRGVGNRRILGLKSCIHRSHSMCCFCRRIYRSQYNRSPMVLNIDSSRPDSDPSYYSRAPCRLTVILCIHQPMLHAIVKLPRVEQTYDTTQHKRLAFRVNLFH